METDVLTALNCQADRSKRLAMRRSMTPTLRAEHARYGREYFDGPTGYGGYYYDGRHESTVRQMIEKYELTPESSVLEVGCAKGFMLYEFHRLGIINVRGCDISEYAVLHGKPEIADRLSVMSADRLDFPDDSFDLVYSIDVLHNLDPDASERAIQEIMRVSCRAAFIQVDSYDTPAEQRNLSDWVVTIKTVRSKDDWRAMFRRLGYPGDYYFKVFTF